MQHHYFTIIITHAVISFYSKLSERIRSQVIRSSLKCIVTIHLD